MNIVGRARLPSAIARSDLHDQRGTRCVCKTSVDSSWTPNVCRGNFRPLSQTFFQWNLSPVAASTNEHRQDLPLQTICSGVSAADRCSRTPPDTHQKLSMSSRRGPACLRPVCPRSGDHHGHTDRSASAAPTDLGRVFMSCMIIIHGTNNQFLSESPRMALSPLPRRKPSGLPSDDAGARAYGVIAGSNKSRSTARSPRTR